jgi:SulP family sulfate permease
MWYRFIPFMLWWPEVTRQSLRADVLAALTGAIVVLPQGVAFAAIAGMPPEYGLYAAMAPAAIAAIFGSSRIMMSGPTTPASILLFSSLSALAVPGSATFVYYALTLTLMVGLIQLGMGFARLGYLVDFISDSVIIGFSAGAAVLILVSQVRDVLGIDLPRGLNIQQVIPAIYERVDMINWMSVEVAMVSIGCGIWAKQALRSVPYMIVAMVMGSVAALGLNTYLYADVALVQVSAVAFPPLSSPGLSFTTWQQLAPTSFAVTFFALTQTISIARSLASRTGDRLDPNQEFIGQGLSNVAGAFLSAYVSTGSFNRSSVNYEAGARTPLASVFAAAMLIVLLFVVAPLLSFMPKAATAGVLFLVAIGIIDVNGIRKILRTSRADSVVLIITFLATVLLTVDFAIILGVLVSIVMFLNRSSQPVVEVQMPDPRNPGRRFNRDPALPECPQVKIVQIDGALFFGAANYVAERLRIIFSRNSAQKHLLILARTINFVDTVGAEVLAREHRRRRSVGGGIYLHQMSSQARALMGRAGFVSEIGKRNFFSSKGEAIAGVFEKLDRGVCAQCRRRVFNECKTLPRYQARSSPAPASQSVANKVTISNVRSDDGVDSDSESTITRHLREPAR